MKLTDGPGLLDYGRRNQFFWDNFHDFAVSIVTSGPGTAVPSMRYTFAGDSNPALGTTVGAPVNLTTGGTNNDYTSLYTTRKPFHLLAGKPFTVAADALFAEATVAGQTNLFLGVTESIAPDMALVADDGGALAADLDVIGFSVLDGQTHLRCVAGIGTSRQTVILDTNDANNLTRRAFLASSAAERRFKIEVRDRFPTQTLQPLPQLEAVFWIDEERVAAIALPSLSGAAVMNLMAAIKTGSANAQTLRMFGWGWEMRR